MHLCIFNKEFIGLGYDYYQPRTFNYGLVTFKLFRCKKCGKLYYENKVFISEILNSSFNVKIQHVRSAGYKSIGELVKQS